jgi:hypothetical protein
MQSINQSINQSESSSIRKFICLSSACFISLILCEASFAANCATAVVSGGAPSLSSCDCNDSGGVGVVGLQVSYSSGTSPYPVTGGGGTNLGLCTNGTDTTCSGSITTGSSTLSFSGTTTYYFKNKLGTNYFKCDLSSSGFSNASVYTIGGAVSAPIDLKFNKQVETFATEIELK